MPLYSKFTDIQTLLRGKVAFTDDDQDENKMQMSTARWLANEAEAQLELDLSFRYLTPFQTVDGNPFGNLPLRPTLHMLKTLAELLTCVRILESDFGRGSAVNGDDYAETLRKRYDALIKRLMGRRDKEANQWLYPPLPGLALAPHNSEADDGYAGMMMNVTDGVGGFAAQQINNPSETLWNATQRDCDAW